MTILDLARASMITKQAMNEYNSMKNEMFNFELFLSKQIDQDTKLITISNQTYS